MMVEPYITKKEIFKAKTNGFYIYRIPSVTVTKEGTILAFSEARKSLSDWSCEAIVMRKSKDNGESWGEMITIANHDGIALNNPTVISDLESGIIHFLYCESYNRVFYMCSYDDGETFIDRKEITDVFMDYKSQYDWNVVAVGPGHGIKLEKGRLIIPIWLAYGSGKSHHPNINGVIYSDDDGKTWNSGELLNLISGSIDEMNETEAIELSDGSVLLNIRTNSREMHQRAFSISTTGIDGWTIPKFIPELYDPICMASIINFKEKNVIVFSNPDSRKQKKFGGRKNLTIKISKDECRSWEFSKVLCKGRSAYSDLAIAKDNSIICLYESGGRKRRFGAYQNITFARFNLEWIYQKS